MRSICSWQQLIALVVVQSLSLICSAAVVVEYHHVSDSTPKSTSISPERFIAHLDYLARAGFAVVPVNQLAEAVRKGQALPDKTIAISFDDAYSSVYTTAFPLLKKRGWPFTVFVNTASVGQSKLFMNWDQLREMNKAGVTIANHSVSHAHLVRLLKDESREQWRARIQSEINNAQQKIELEIGTAPKIFAYPFGEYDAQTQTILKELGYIAFGQQSGPLSPTDNPQALPRFPFGGMFTELEDFILKVNTLPMSIKSRWADDRGQPLDNLIVRAGARPWLVIKPEDTNLLKRINCFATGQGAITTQVRGEELWVRAVQPLKQGRTRYNCTAASGEKGRFVWFTQQWLATDLDGEWRYQD